MSKYGQTRLVLPNLPVNLVARDKASSYGCFGNVAVVIGFGNPDVLAIRNYEHCVTTLSAAYPEGVGLITVVLSNSTPGAGARDNLVRMFRNHAQSLRACLFIDLAQGLAAATHRSLGAALILAVGNQSTVRIETSIARGTTWFATRWRLPPNLGVVSTAHQIAKRVEDFYRVEAVLRPS